MHLSPSRTGRLLLILCCFSFALTAQQSTNERVLARAELGTKEIDIGDQLWLEVNISAPPATQVSPLPPGFLDAAPGLEVMEENPLNTVSEAPELLLQQRLKITSFDTGYIVVPPLPYAYVAADGRKDTAYTEDLLLRVHAFPVGEEDELRPIKPIIEEPLNLLDFWPLFLVLALGGIGYLIWHLRQRRERQAPPPPPPPPADVIALTELRDLEGKELWQQGQTKEYYSELTRILREYLEGRFDVPAMEMTTRQITQELGRRENLDRLQRSELS
ncbi:MAG: hypothetical protein AAFN92_04860, partial [Bacteroidota bacterium]